MDGNVGIGGDPVTLLTRLRELPRPGGRLLAEADLLMAVDGHPTLADLTPEALRRVL